MPRHYLARYLGDGTSEANPFRPSGADEMEGVAAIDLRPDPTRPDGFAILRAPDPLPTSPNRVTLGDDPDEVPTSARRRDVESRLALPVGALDGVDRWRRVIARLLLDHGDDADPGRWNRLRPERNAYRVWLGGPLFEMPRPSGAAVYADDFNRAALGAGWTVTVGDLEIVTNVIRQITAAATASIARFESDLATVNQYGQVVIPAFNLIGTGIKQLGATVRHSVVDDTHYSARRRWADSQASERFNIYKRVAGTETALWVAASGVNIAVGDVVRTEVDGSTVRSVLNGVTIQSVTDTSIVGGLRAGVALSSPGATGRAQGDNWEAGDLAAAQTAALEAATLALAAQDVTATPAAIARALEAATVALTATSPTSTPGPAAALLEQATIAMAAGSPAAVPAAVSRALEAAALELAAVDATAVAVILRDLAVAVGRARPRILAGMAALRARAGQPRR